MKKSIERKTYIVCDGMEFDNKEECLEYEHAVILMLEEIDDAYDFYKNGKNILWRCNNIDDEWQAFKKALRECDYIFRKANLTEETNNWIDEVDNAYINKKFDYELGAFRWNSNIIEWEYD